MTDGDKAAFTWTMERTRHSFLHIIGRGAVAPKVMHKEADKSLEIMPGREASVLNKSVA